MDEVRLANTPPSSNRVWASWMNLASNSTWCVVGPVESSPEVQDSNGDGIVDAWTVNYFAHDPFVEGAAGYDPDGDFSDNFAEYIVGSNPTNDLDLFQISLALVNGLPVVSIPTRETTIEFYGPLKRHYTLESCTNLTLSGWIAVPGYSGIPATGQLLDYTNSLPGRIRFYRARTWLE
jgi:hypothetical protein